jgi:hypothetical protein
VDRQGRAHGPLGVVLVGERDAERRHHRITGELLDDASVRGDAGGDVVEEPLHAPPNDLRVGAGDEVRRRHEIDEKHRRELAFHR